MIRLLPGRLRPAIRCNDDGLVRTNCSCERKNRLDLSDINWGGVEFRIDDHLERMPLGLNLDEHVDLTRLAGYFVRNHDVSSDVSEVVDLFVELGYSLLIFLPGHHFVTLDADSGTRKITATGKVRSSNLA